MKKRILITPINKLCNSYEEQREILNQFQIYKVILPPNIRFIVIYNISYNLRFEINKSHNIADIPSIIDDFFCIQLFPLVIYCHRKQFTLILLHEITYNPKLDQNLKFLKNLYNQLDSLNVFLNDNPMDTYKKMEITIEDIKWFLNYLISNNGFIFKG